MTLAQRQAISSQGTPEAEIALNAAGDWLEAHDYHGNDPYQLDSVITSAASRPFIGPLVGLARKTLKPYHAWIPRRVFTAAKPILIPQALGDALSAEGLRRDYEGRERRIQRLLALILQARSPLAKHTGWGLPFPWGGIERHPPHWPTTITTTFVLHGVLDALPLLDHEVTHPLLQSAVRFLFEECGVEETPAGVCLRFGPGDGRLILNVNAAAAAVLLRIAKVLEREDLVDFARRALRLVVSHQNADGSWYYAPQHGSHALDTIIDSRHTGYILEALAEANRALDDTDINKAIAKGWHYVETSLLEDEKPRWSPEETWPVDAHDTAQAIMTALTLGKHELARRHMIFALQNFARSDGGFGYKLFPDGRRNDTVFIRWSQAPMYKALARYQQAFACE